MIPAINGEGRRTLFLANVFNFLAGVYLILIAIISLIHLRWYHLITVRTAAKHFITSPTSYFSFLMLLAVGIVLITVFLVSVVKCSPQEYNTPENLRQDAIEVAPTSKPTSTQQQNENRETQVKTKLKNSTTHLNSNTNIVIKRSRSVFSSRKKFLSTVGLHLLANIGLVVILILWLLNTGEFVRDAILGQLSIAFDKYQFGMRSNYLSVAIDGMQDSNNCCGNMEYTDFPHSRTSGLTSGHYPGSCCGKNIYGAENRAMCMSEEIVRARQNTGCLQVLANYYDTISLLVVPITLGGLFINIMLIALLMMSRVEIDSNANRQSFNHSSFRSRQNKQGDERLELKSTMNESQ